MNLYVGNLAPMPGVLPPEVTKAFVRDVRAFFRAKDQMKKDEIDGSSMLGAASNTKETARQEAPDH